MVLYCPILVIIIQCCKPCHLMAQVIMEKILALIRKNDPLISAVMWPCHLLPVLPALPSDYPGHGNCFCCIIVTNITPHLATLHTRAVNELLQSFTVPREGRLAGCIFYCRNIVFDLSIYLSCTKQYWLLHI